MPKLKRFLLRYEPPGIGLEVQMDDGEVEIIHKDLPEASEIHSAGAIHTVVDKIIANSDSLLTAKRHKPALIQLLERLYMLEADDVGPSGDEEERVSGASPKANGLGSLLQEGNRVIMIGLKGDQIVHNGESGILTKCKPDKQKFEVNVYVNGAASKNFVKVKGAEHLVPAAASSTLACGYAVVIRGLRSHTELNGCLGRVEECHEESHRYEVRAIEGGQLFRVKQENLVPIDPSFSPQPVAKENREPNIPPAVTKAPGTSSMGAGEASAMQPGTDSGEFLEPGSLVELHGLKTAVQHNGQTAEVLSVDRTKLRCEIRLTNDGSVKTIRTDNLRLLPRPSKASPRNPRRNKDSSSQKAADRGK